MQRSNNNLSSTLTAVAGSTAAIAAVYAWSQRPPKPQDLHVQAQCKCGNVCLTVDEPSPVHLVCYCDDCQNYARWVANQTSAEFIPATTESHAHTVVDAQGGSRTCQVFRRHVQILRGAELLKFSYLDPTQVPSSRPQRMYRAHATCCNTPICSAFWRELPVMGLYAANFVLRRGVCLSPDPDTQRWGQQDVRTVSGGCIPAPEYRINCQYAKEGPIPGGHPEFPIPFLLRFLWRNYVVGPKVMPGDFDLQQSLDEVTMRLE